jgi:uncharacterized membrane protein (DUF106 family)
MLEWAWWWLVAGLDAALMPLVRLLPDGAVAGLGVLTAGVLLVLRRLATNQDLLRRCAQDRKCLRVLLRQDRRSGDGASARRHGALRRRVVLKAMSQEWRPVLAAIVPLAILGGWCFERLEYLPRPGDAPAKLTLWLPLSAQGQLVHVVPQEGLEATDGWVRVAAAAAGGVPRCEASWELKGSGSTTVLIRHGQSTYRRLVSLGQAAPAPVEVRHPDGAVSRLDATPYRPLGFIRPVLGLPAWLMWYLLVSLASYPLLKRLLRVW